MKIALTVCVVVACLSPALVAAQQYVCLNDGDSIQSSGGANWEAAAIPSGALAFSLTSELRGHRTFEADIFIPGDRERLANCERWDPNRGFGQCSNEREGIQILLHRSKETGHMNFILHAREQGLDRLGLKYRIRTESLVIKGTCQLQ